MPSFVLYKGSVLNLEGSVWRGGARWGGRWGVPEICQVKRDNMIINAKELSNPIKKIKNEKLYGKEVGIETAALV